MVSLETKRRSRQSRWFVRKRAIFGLPEKELKKNLRLANNSFSALLQARVEVILWAEQPDRP